MVHERLDEKQAAAAGLFEIRGIRGVLEAGGVETRSFIAHGVFGLAARHGRRDVNMAVAVGFLLATFVETGLIGLVITSSAAGFTSRLP